MSDIEETLIRRNSVAFLVHDGTVFLGDHRKHKKWLPPGGGIESGENEVQALFRELYEEIGVNYKSIRLYTDRPVPQFKSSILESQPIPAQKGRFIVPDGRVFETYIFYGNIDSKDVKVDDVEFKEHRWFTSTNLDQAEVTGLLDEDVLYYAREALSLCA